MNHPRYHPITCAAIHYRFAMRAYRSRESLRATNRRLCRAACDLDPHTYERHERWLAPVFSILWSAHNEHVRLARHFGELAGIPPEENIP